MPTCLSSKTCEGKEQFDIGDRFEYIKTLGKGSYGIVCSAYDKKLQKKVAIKKITKLNDSIVLKRTLRELKLLKFFKDSPNVSF